MKMKTWLPAVLAIVLGGAAAFLVRNSMMRPKAVISVPATPKMVPAVVAVSDLIAGQQVLAENISVIDVPSSNVPGEIISNTTAVVGRVLKEPVGKGQTINDKNLAPRGVAANLPSLIPAGMRAMTINVDEGNTISGMVLPGCHVDVLATVNAGKDSISRTLVPDVLVQAVGTRLTSAKPEDGKEPPAFHTLTLIVTTRQAQLLDLGHDSARIRVLLRPLTKGASDDMALESTTMKELMAGEDAPATPRIAETPTTQRSPDNTPVAIATPKRDITLILGSNVTHVKVDAPEPTQPEVTHTDNQPVIDGSEPRQD